MQTIKPITAYLFKDRIIHNGYFIAVHEHKDAQYLLEIKNVE
jgi:hypothetical protein